MATRRPLVTIAGQTQELPVGDSLPGIGIGGLALTSAVLTVPYTARGHAVITISDGAVSLASAVSVSLSGGASTEENEAEDVAEWSISATPGDGVITFNLYSPGPFGGPVNINYLVG
jgi:hypothetical protein